MAYIVYNEKKLTNHFVERFYERIYKRKINHVSKENKRKVLHEINILMNKPEVVSMMKLFGSETIKVKYKDCRIVIRNRTLISIIPKNEHLKKVDKKMPYSMSYGIMKKKAKRIIKSKGLKNTKKRRHKK